MVFPLLNHPSVNLIKSLLSPKFSLSPTFESTTVICYRCFELQEKDTITMRVNRFPM